MHDGLWVLDQFCLANKDAFIKVWVRRRQCPLPLSDYLTELGMEKAAACALWTRRRGLSRGTAQHGAPRWAS